MPKILELAEIKKSIEELENQNSPISTQQLKNLFDEGKQQLEENVLFKFLQDILSDDSINNFIKVYLDNLCDCPNC